MKKTLFATALFSLMSLCVLATDHLVPKHDNWPDTGPGPGAEPRHWYERFNGDTGEYELICAYTWSTPCE